MWPTLAEDDIILANCWSRPKTGDVVLARVAGKDLIKRVTSVSQGQYWLMGDNYQQSHDSRKFGLVKPNEIIGVVFGYPRSFKHLPKLSGAHASNKSRDAKI